MICVERMKVEIWLDPDLFFTLPPQRVENTSLVFQLTVTTRFGRSPFIRKDYVDNYPCFVPARLAFSEGCISLFSLVLGKVGFWVDLEQ